MKKLLFALLVMPICATAQVSGEVATVECALPADSATVQAQFGIIDYQGVLEMMPEWAEAQQRLADLKARYDAETERAEAEFQRKFAEFLEGQQNFPQNIMEKRQRELQTLLEESVQFRQSVGRLLREAETDFTANARRRLDAAMRTVARDNGLLFIFNSDNNQVPYVDVDKVMDVEHAVLQALGL